MVAALGRSEIASSSPPLNFRPSLTPWIPTTTLSRPMEINMLVPMSSAHIRAAYSAMGPRVTQTMRRAQTLVSPRSFAAQLMSRARFALPKRAYCTATSSSWETAMPKNMQEQPARRPFSLSRFVKTFLSLGAVALYSTSVWWLHTELHRNNPTWVSWLAFIPLLGWIPMFDMAGLDRAWILVPLAAVAFAQLPISFAPFLGITAFAGTEFYRNYHLLGRFEVGTFLSAAIMTAFRTQWIYMSALAILGPEQYQLVPHSQASTLQLLIMVCQRLNKSIDDPSIIDAYNFPFLFFNYIWSAIPQLQRADLWLSSLRSQPDAIEEAEKTEEKS